MLVTICHDPAYKYENSLQCFAGVDRRHGFPQVRDRRAVMGLSSATKRASEPIDKRFSALHKVLAFEQQDKLASTISGIASSPPCMLYFTSAGEALENEYLQQLKAYCFNKFSVRDELDKILIERTFAVYAIQVGDHSYFQGTETEVYWTTKP